MKNITTVTSKGAISLRLPTLAVGSHRWAITVAVHAPLYYVKADRDSGQSQRNCTLTGPNWQYIEYRFSHLGEYVALG